MVPRGGASSRKLAQPEWLIPFMERVLRKARTLTDRKLLVRLDSAHDAVETRAFLRNADKVSYIIKWNPRTQETAELYNRAFAEGKVSEPRKEKRIALLTVRHHQVHKGTTYVFTKVVRVTERTIDKHGQLLLQPEITVEGWWTNLDLPEKKIISLYRGHALCEQFHSEFKTDLDLEGCPAASLPLIPLSWLSWRSVPLRTISCGSSASSGCLATDHRSGTLRNDGESERSSRN